MRKIGVIDSGVGGLTLLRDIMGLNASAQFYYISDEDNVPYGDKSQDFMLNQMIHMTNKLLEVGVEGIVIACNTATAETIDRLRLLFKIPFVGIEPYINYINKSELAPNSNVGLILTPATFRSKRFQELRLKYDPANRVDVIPMKYLALLIESLKWKSFDQIKAEIDTEISLLKDKKFDYLILGCTHYPIIQNYLEEHLNLKTIDPARSVAQHIVKSFNLFTNYEGKQFKYNPNLSDKWIDVTFSSFNFFK
jgi:glutamate racemase